MTATALIKFTQGMTVGADGEAFLGETGSAVTVNNSDNTDVASWQIDLVYTPADSAVPTATPLASSNNSSTPSANFTPDVSGSYRLVLYVYAQEDMVGTPDIDIRCFSVADPVTGYIRPPFQMLPLPRPLLGSDEEGEKPNELNFNGNPYGWLGRRGDGLLDDVLYALQTMAFDGSAAGGDLSGTYPNPTVSEINGTSVPAGGALSTGQVLRATGVDAADWGPVDLANSDAVEGILPAANQEEQTMGGDVSGTTDAATVVALRGRSVSADTPDAGTHLGFKGGAWHPLTAVQPAQYSGVSNTDYTFSASTQNITIFTVPSQPTSTGRFVLTHVLVRVSSALLGAGNVVLTVGSSIGGTQYILSQTITSATPEGTVYGITVSQLGSAFGSASGYNVLLDAGASVWMRLVGSGTITGGAVRAYVFGLWLSDLE